VALDQSITLYCFTDVLPDSPNYDAIQGLGSLGIIQGYGPDGGGYFQFRGTNSVMRAQYTKFITGALNAAGETGYNPVEGMAAPVTFSDLGADNPADLYPHEFVWTVWSHGIVKGYDDGTFRPYIPIQRGHVISMTVRALQGIEPSPLMEPPVGYMPTWGNDMLPEHKANARIAEYNGLLDNIPLASGVASMPRQEVAQVMWNMLNLLTAP
ncbi:MAG: S-layer homology domain-containing protein, partial [Actinobacteria bacterium]|nr:S-layer homology domain-containing protein [Actinomycetota bacterium]